MILYIPQSGFGGAASLGQGSLGPEVNWANLMLTAILIFLNKIYFVRSIAAHASCAEVAGLCRRHGGRSWRRRHGPSEFEVRGLQVLSSSHPAAKPACAPRVLSRHIPSYTHARRGSSTSNASMHANERHNRTNSRCVLHIHNNYARCILQMEYIFKII